MEYLPATWFQRPAVAVAPDLLGCTLVRRWDPPGTLAEDLSHPLRGTIVETEAYEPDDPACHAYRRRTPRNEAMFAPGGHSYIYLIYGVHHCFNVVTDQAGVGSAVLIRALALDPQPGLAAMVSALSSRVKSPAALHRIAAGPGKLCKVLELDRTLNHKPLIPDSGLWIEPRSPDLDRAIQRGTEPIVQTTRIGLSQGIDLPWRWYLQRSTAVSRRVRE